MELPIPLDRPLAFFDLETTGLSRTSDRIIEIAVIRVSPQGDVMERVRRFNPGMPIPPEVTAIHGITDEDVADEPPFPARAKSLAELLEPCDLAGFNLRRFDLPLLLAEFTRAGIAFDPRSRRLLDMQVIFHREEPRGYCQLKLVLAHSDVSPRQQTPEFRGFPALRITRFAVDFA